MAKKSKEEGKNLIVEHEGCKSRNRMALRRSILEGFGMVFLIGRNKKQN